MKLAIFDFDGTLSRGYIWMAFLDYLNANGLYPDTFYDKQMLLAEENRQGRLGYDEWCDKCGDLWAKAFAGVPHSKVSNSASRFFRSFRKNIYASSYKLVDAIKGAGFTPVIVSAAPYEAIRLGARDPGVGKVYATELETKHGICTGKAANPLYRHGKKLKAIKTLSRKYGLAGSAGFGDSIGDKDLLENVEFPIALNPSPELRKLAKRRRWLIASKSNVASVVLNEIKQKHYQTITI